MKDCNGPTMEAKKNATKCDYKRCKQSLLKTQSVVFNWHWTVLWWGCCVSMHSDVPVNGAHDKTLPCLVYFNIINNIKYSSSTKCVRPAADLKNNLHF